MSGPIIAIGSVIAFGQRGFFLTSAALTAIGLLIIVIAIRTGGEAQGDGTAVGAVDPEHTQSAMNYDAELQRHNEVLRQAVGVQLHDNVLDIGCGSGQTARQAARTARAGSALGIDVSGPAIERARAIARAEELHNVTFEQGDAQVHGFAPDNFDLAISRFGTMFFDDPVAAFTNIRRALRPGGRLVMMVWQTSDGNEWDRAIHQSLGSVGAPMSNAPETPDPFSLGDPQIVEEILKSAGFVDVDFADVDEPVYYGPDVAAALAWTCGFTSTSEVLKRLDPAAATKAVDRLREELAAHLRDDGVWFNSRAWVVSARRD